MLIIVIGYRRGDCIIINIIIWSDLFSLSLSLSLSLSFVIYVPCACNDTYFYIDIDLLQALDTGRMNYSRPSEEVPGICTS